MLKEKLEQRKCFPTAWGKLIPEEEAYRQLNRQIAAMTANLFQVMRIFEPSWEKRTEAICDIANMMNMAVAGTPEEQKDYVNASLYEAFNIPELCEKVELARRHHRRLRRRVGEHGRPRRAVHAQPCGKGARYLSVGHRRQRALQHDDQYVHGELRPCVLQGHGERGRAQHVSGPGLRQQALPRRRGAPRRVRPSQAGMARPHAAARRPHPRHPARAHGQGRPVPAQRSVHAELRRGNVARNRVPLGRADGLGLVHPVPDDGHQGHGARRG